MKLTISGNACKNAPGGTLLIDANNIQNETAAYALLTWLREFEQGRANIVVSVHVPIDSDDQPRNMSIQMINGESAKVVHVRGKPNNTMFLRKTITPGVS